MKLCSACLLGINCRYNGKTKPSKKVLELAKKEVLIPVCPEILGGLEIPRDPFEQKGDKVFSQDGEDFTKQFEIGAEKVLEIAKKYNIKEAILKQRSPSCGCGQIYDGTFSGKVIEGDGVTTKLLKKNKIKIITEEEL
ncbi:DUF523 domain-containing protein [Candidatus Micrarchaeota archaeon]|nr:DUF523 domain-containing protein [Candidatus Micrarchaeota archaeon]